MLNMSDHQVVSTDSRGVPGIAVDSVQSAVTLSQRTSAVLMGLDLVLEHHNAPRSIRDDLSKQVHHALDSSESETVWLKRMKFVLTYPLAKYLRNPLPPKPDLAFSPSGNLRRWMKQRLCCFNRKNTHLWYSWLQSKRSSLPASKSLVRDTYDKHFETLTREDPGKKSTIDRIMSNQCFKNVIRRIREDIADRLVNDDFTKSTASGNASFENKRNQGGQQSYLKYISEHDQFTVDENLSLQSKLPYDPVYGRMFNVPVEKCRLPRSVHGEEPQWFYPETKRWTRNETLPGEVDSVVVDELISMTADQRSYSSDKPVTHEVKDIRVPCGYDDWCSLRTLIPQEEVDRPVNCTIQGVLEPMKIRVISKGESLPYYSCKSLQKAIHSSMREMSCFRLIGRPFSPTDLIELAMNADRNAPDLQWFSIDYSAATDGLSYEYSSRIFEKIIKYLPEELKTRARRVLGLHELYYPGELGTAEYRGLQTNGQLMGSILSFPILCLANLGVYLDVTQIYQYGWSDKKRLDSVLINGDDMVYAAPKNLWEDHVETSGEVGLEMSQGKAYCHKEYANVNSTSVHYDLDNVKSTPWQIDFLNTGLIFGQHKVQERSDDGKVKGTLRIKTYDSDGYIECFDNEGKNIEVKTRWKSPMLTDEQISRMIGKLTDEPVTDESKYLVPTINVILKGSLPGKQKNILKQFLSKHHSEISQECFGLYRSAGKTHLFTRNLFLPCSLGGMGIDPPQGFSYKIKKVQRNVAKSCILNEMRLGCQMSSQRPLAGEEVGDGVASHNTPWVRKVTEPVMFGHTNKNLNINVCLKLKREMSSFQGIRFCPLNYPEEELMMTAPMSDYFEEKEDLPSNTRLLH